MSQSLKCSRVKKKYNFLRLKLRALISKILSCVVICGNEDPLNSQKTHEVILNYSNGEVYKGKKLKILNSHTPSEQRD